MLLENNHWWLIMSLQPLSSLFSNKSMSWRVTFLSKLPMTFFKLIKRHIIFFLCLIGFMLRKSHMISSCCHLHHNSYKQCFLHHFLFFSHEVKKTIKCSLCCYWNCKAIHYEDFSMLEYIKTAEPDCWKTVRLKNVKKKKAPRRKL